METSQGKMNFPKIFQVVTEGCLFQSTLEITYTNVQVI